MSGGHFAPDPWGNAKGKKFGGRKAESEAVTLRVRRSFRTGMGIGLVFGVGVGCFAYPASGQTYRAWVGSSVQMAQLRPVGLDTIPASEVVAGSDGTFLHDGYQIGRAHV